MNVYALTDGNQTMAIFATETEALAAARTYMAERMWHYCQIRVMVLGDIRPTGGTVLWYEEQREMVQVAD